MCFGWFITKILHVVDTTATALASTVLDRVGENYGLPVSTISVQCYGNDAKGLQAVALEKNP